jgi:zinc/manganese transport system substrate-binding protein
MDTKIIKLVSILILTFSLNAEAKLKVVASTEDIASIVQEIGGDKIDLDFIARGALDAHYIEAKPSFMVKLNKANLLVSNGLSLEEGWLPSLIQGSRNPDVHEGQKGNLDLGKFISPLEVPKGKVSRAEGDVHPGGNPHYTLDPQRIIDVSDKIAERLSELDPANKDYFKNETQKFKDQLSAKMVYWKIRLNKISDKRVITYHDSLRYFLHRFGFTSAAFIEPKPGIPPSAKHLADLVELIKREHIKIVLVQSFFDTSFDKNFRDAGINLAIKKVGISKGATPELKTYLDVMENLVSALESANQ